VAILRLNIAKLRQIKKGANRVVSLSSVDGSGGCSGAWPHSPSLLPSIAVVRSARWSSAKKGAVRRLASKEEDGEMRRGW
jgi:hypothetical protein